MEYHDESQGFSLSLPEGWQAFRHVFPPTFGSDHGTIQVKKSVPLPQYVNPAARMSFMKEPGLEVMPSIALGSETVNVIGFTHPARGEGYISAVRDGVHYEILWTHCDHPAVREALALLQSSFTFPPPEAAKSALARAAALSPQQRAVAAAVIRGGSSREELETHLQSAGLVKQVGPASGLTMWSIPTPLRAGQQASAPGGGPQGRPDSLGRRLVFTLFAWGSMGFAATVGSVHAAPTTGLPVSVLQERISAFNRTVLSAGIGLWVVVGITTSLIFAGLLRRAMADSAPTRRTASQLPPHLAVLAVLYGLAIGWAFSRFYATVDLSGTTGVLAPARTRTWICVLAAVLASTATMGRIAKAPETCLHAGRR